MGNFNRGPLDPLAAFSPRDIRQPPNGSNANLDRVLSKHCYISPVKPLTLICSCDRCISVLCSNIHSLVHYALAKSNLPWFRLPSLSPQCFTFHTRGSFALIFIHFFIFQLSRMFCPRSVEIYFISVLFSSWFCKTAKYNPCYEATDPNARIGLQGAFHPVENKIAQCDSKLMNQLLG